MKKYALAAGTFIGLIILWEALVRIFAVPLYILPAPSAIASALVRVMPELWPHVLATLWETVAGILCAIAAAFVLALVMDAFAPVKAALYPLLAMSQAIPVLVIAPLLIIYLGFGILPKIFTVALMCFFPITVSLSASMAQVDQAQINLLRSLGAKGIGQIYRYLKLPAALPGFFSGLRMSATYSVTGAVVGEWLSADKGLGFVMLRAKNAYMLDRVFAIVLLIVLLSLLLLGLTVLLEKIALPYRYKKTIY